MSSIPQILTAIMDKTGWKQDRLAEKLDVTQATVSRWMNGADPKGSKHKAIEKLYREIVLDGHLDSMDVAAMVGGSDLPRHDHQVRVVGYVGAGAAVTPFDDHEKGAGLDVVEVDFPVKHGTVGVIVRGDSMLPMFEDGDLIGYIRDATGPEQLIGKICVVKVVDGPTYIKRLKRGSEAGLYTLVSANASDIDDVEIEWAARYRFHLPADEWRTLRNGD